MFHSTKREVAGFLPARVESFNLSSLEEVSKLLGEYGQPTIVKGAVMFYTMNKLVLFM